jgi:NAD(P)-dependent dehydrogenase (short-subunit alcohol dehydrogenase family)
MIKIGVCKSVGGIRLFSLKNQNFVITGGSRGLGKMISEKISELGGNTIVVSRNAIPVLHPFY